MLTRTSTNEFNTNLKEMQKRELLCADTTSLEIRALHGPAYNHHVLAHLSASISLSSASLSLSSQTSSSDKLFFLALSFIFFSMSLIAFFTSLASIFFFTSILLPDSS